MSENCLIGGVLFEWDSNKAELVLKEHSLTMQECASVLINETTITKPDYRHYDEERFISTGYSNQAKILTVIWTDRGDRIRLITGFKATKDQTKEFHRG
ncbi:hypothetical protein B0181_11885 [Moraxella caviae]|uniref:Protein of uncharacterized function (DUF497) n=1 Tax=Moraxella caviae TaxID=34060 RepID=A0A1S9ZRZ4_9GAMM|nr:BrnT family toxin [Moraxella caviae]OOR85821.1 hypothetical protein B0181_11885 [Moraxella caviae]STZ13508.1 Protein of uncharacterised function (DUF497) [Moraxella caviae]STZ13713.1 Protein of uncharacterised function (DUF497) [Moraxella caviae]